MGDKSKVPYAIRASSWMLLTRRIQVLDSLHVEGNTSTKQDVLSSWACSVDRYPDDEDSYKLDVPGESCLGWLDDSQPVGWMSRVNPI